MLRIKLLGVALMLMSGVALAHTGATGIVGARMQQMLDMGQALRTVHQAVMSGSVDIETMQAIAIIRSGAQELPEKFQIEEYGQGSDARPRIWTQWSAFVQIADELDQAAAELNSAIKAEDFANAEFSLREVQAACAACHTNFRFQSGK